MFDILHEDTTIDFFIVPNLLVKINSWKYGDPKLANSVKRKIIAKGNA